MAALAEPTMQEECLSTFNAQAVANIAWAYARLGIKNAALMAALAEQTMQEECLSTFDAQAVANTAWAYARLGIKNEALMATLAGPTWGVWGVRDKPLRARTGAQNMQRCTVPGVHNTGTLGGRAGS